MKNSFASLLSGLAVAGNLVIGNAIAETQIPNIPATWNTSNIQACLTEAASSPEGSAVFSGLKCHRSDQLCWVTVTDEIADRLPLGRSASPLLNIILDTRASNKIDFHFVGSEGVSLIFSTDRNNELIESFRANGGYAADAAARKALTKLPERDQVLVNEMLALGRHNPCVAPGA